MWIWFLVLFKIRISMSKIDDYLIIIEFWVDLLGRKVFILIFFIRREYELFLFLELFFWNWNIWGDIGLDLFWMRFIIFIFGDDILLMFVVGKVVCCWL